MTRELAEQDMIDGFLDGYDPHSPEPGPNRSDCYRHGFLNGRDDLARKPRDNYENLKRQAELLLLAAESR